jgi:hypothetical protein
MRSLDVINEGKKEVYLHTVYLPNKTNREASHISQEHKSKVHSFDYPTMGLSIRDVHFEGMVGKLQVFFKNNAPRSFLS